MRSESVGFVNYSDYVLRGSLVKSSFVWQVALSEYTVFIVIYFLTTAQDRPTAKGSSCGLVPNSAESGVILSLPSAFVEATTKFGFFHVVRSTSFDTALSYVTIRCSREIDWRSVPCSCHRPFSPCHWRRTIVRERLAVEGGAKCREDGTDYRLPRQETSKVT